MKKPMVSQAARIGWARLAGLLPLLVFLGFGCTPDKQEARTPPNLVIIGEDLSGTFAAFPETTEEDLRALCIAISKTKSGGKVYFIGIGSSTPKGYAYCTIHPPKSIPPGATPSTVKRIKHQNVVIARQNAAASDQFLVSAAGIFQQRKQDFTDINGFFDKARSIILSPSHKRFSKWLYINSDGKQDTPRSKQMNCELLPPVDKFFVNRGWKESPDCNANGQLPDTPHFIEYFQEETAPKTAEDQNDY
ncbi:MAG: hypothetical protein H6574_24900 [Lewinellaceae bacterium]|nr:hypothetical protein [Lewinellaceae bacterium]MCB9334300.1 hypothetical protein [Lewinellaceae bacterium]